MTAQAGGAAIVGGGAAQRLAEELLRLRKGRGLTQRALAALVCSTESTIRRAEKGQRIPPMRVVVACDRALESGQRLTRLRLAVDTGLHQPAGGSQVPAARAARDDVADVQGWRGVLDPMVSVLGVADDLRRSVDEMLDDGTPQRCRLGRLEARVDQCASEALTTAPLTMIGYLWAAIADVRELRRTGGSLLDQRRLSAAAARLSVMAADGLSVLGALPAARGLYDTARVAAQASGDPVVLADVLALTALLPLHHGRADEAARLAGQARAVAGSRSCLAAALAPMLEAAAWARVGNPDAARDAFASADAGYRRLTAEHRGESFFAFSPRRRLFYEGRIWTDLADYRRAWTIHDQALRLYPPEAIGDTALIFLDRAMGLVATGQAADGAELVTTTLLGLPAGYRGRLFVATAQRVIAAVPARAERLPAVRACQEVLCHLDSCAPVALSPGGSLPIWATVPPGQGVPATLPGRRGA